MERDFYETKKTARSVCLKQIRVSFIDSYFILCQKNSSLIFHDLKISASKLPVLSATPKRIDFSNLSRKFVVLMVLRFAQNHKNNNKFFSYFELLWFPYQTQTMLCVCCQMAKFSWTITRNPDDRILIRNQWEQTAIIFGDFLIDKKIRNFLCMTV